MSSTVDAASMADQFAYYDIFSAESRFNTQLNVASSKHSAYTSLKTTLSSLKTSLYDFTKYNGTVAKSAATVSSDEYLSVSADDNASASDLDIFVEQTATAQQVAFDFEGIQDPQTLIQPATGAMSIERNGEAIYEINFAELQAKYGDDISYQDLVNDINASTDDVNANLVRTNGELKLMISSAETGEENAFTMTHDIGGISSDAHELKSAQDAVIWLGGEGTGMRVTNSSNTFTDLTDGVDVTLKKAQESGSETTNISVATDTSATEEALNEFIDKYNEIIGEINSLTATSSSEDGTRGVLASDTMARSIKSNLTSLLRNEHNGNYLFELGFELDRDGKLSLDSSAFEEAFSSGDIDINDMLIGDTGLFGKLETVVDSYSKSGTGMLTNRIDTLDQQKSNINDNLDALELKYEKSYNRYLRQFTAMNEAITSMESAMSAFAF